MRPAFILRIPTAPGGENLFLDNTPVAGGTLFLRLGEALDELVLQRVLPANSAGGSRLFVVRQEVEYFCREDEKEADSESHTELINILDRASEIATMGALFSSNNGVALF